MWDLDGGLRVVRALQPITRKFNYHLTLGGGVLNNGASKKDLDLYFLPMGGFDDSKECDPDGMLSALERLWGTAEPLAASFRNKVRYGRATSSFYKHAVQFSRRAGVNKDISQRIDCFIF